jgi:hypothetical protein
MRSRAVTWLARGLINLPGGSADSCNLGLHGLASATTWRTSNLNDIGTQHMGQPMQLLWHSTAAAEARSSSQSAHHKGQEQRAAQTSAAKGFVRGGFSVDMVSWVCSAARQWCTTDFRRLQEVQHLLHQQPWVCCPHKNRWRHHVLGCFLPPCCLLSSLPSESATSALWPT